MTRAVLVALALAGCEQVLGIHPPHAVSDAAGDGASCPKGMATCDAPVMTGCARAPTFATPTTYGGIAGATAFATGDLNHDGFIDIAIVGASANVVILHGTTGGHLGSQATVAMPPPATGGRVVKAVDLDRDTFVDLVYVTTGGSNVIVAQRQDATAPGTFLAPVQVGAIGPMFGDLAIADLDGDGLLDIVAPDTGETGVNVFFQDATNHGSFVPPIDVTLGTTAGAFLVAGVGDFNHDGKLDVMGLADNTVKYALHDATQARAFGPPVAVGPAMVMDAVAGDIDGDGFDDILVGAQPTVILYQNPQAPGSFAASSPLQLSALKFDALADINRDGRIDVVSQGNFDLQCAAPMPARTFSTGTFGPQATGYADIDGDGKPDLILLDGGTMTIGVGLQQ